MHDIVIVPTFDRPEFLWLCLESLLAAEGIEDKIVMVCEDIHSDKPKGFTVEMEMLATIRYFEKEFGFQFHYTAPVPHTTYGNSYNLLSALEEATFCENRLVYIIEDDVLITKDFFTWNEQVYEKFRPWVSCAGRLNRSLNFESNGRYAMDETIKDVNACTRVKGAYMSWATCFPRTSLDLLLHSERIQDQTFGPGVEQDILIQNMMRRYGLSSLWPFVPRAYHMGWYSYHRTGGILPQGTLEQKVNALRAVVTKQNKLREVAGIQDIDAFQEHEAATALYLR
jgi:hypothetical protein